MSLKKPKEKGRRAELEFAKMIQDTGLDDNAGRMPGSGAFKGLESDIRTKLPIAFEIKNQESWSPLAYYHQAHQELHWGDGKIPVVVMKKNNEDFYAFLKAQDFLNILFYAIKAGWPDKIPEEKNEIHPVPKPIKKNY